MAKQPKVFFSFRSPYSWLALDKLTKLGLRERFEYIPLWEPGKIVESELEREGAHLLYENMSRSKHLYILQDVKRLANTRGKTLAWPVDIEPEWDLPHLAWIACRQLGTEWEFYDSVVDLRWSAGVDVCLEENLRPVMDECGLGGISLEDLRTDSGTVARAVAALKETYDNDIFGMPYFKAGFHRFWGLDRLEAFLTHLGMDQVDADPLQDVPEDVALAVRSYDTDTAGGCG